MAKFSSVSKKVILFIIFALVFWALGAGSYHSLSAADSDTYKGLKLFSEVIELVEKNYIDEVDAKRMIENAIQGLVHGLDPHSTLLTPDEFKEMQIDTKGEFTGVGIHISMRDGLITVVAPIEGTPAHKAGIVSGDRIIKVDGKTVKDLREAVNLIRGPKGSQVVVTIARKDAPEPIDFAIIRDVIPIQSVRSVELQPGYGYVRITNFRENTTKDLKDALAKLDGGTPPLKGLILDLRDNPGGLLSQSIEVADLFLVDGKILSIKGRQGKNTREFNAQQDGHEKPYPMVVLINGGSASASEIVAGALQDQKRALIIGTNSFGKGSVQNLERLMEGYGLKLTVARYYTPSGRSIQAKGIEPDIVVSETAPQPSDDARANRSRTKEKDLDNHLDAEPENTKKTLDKDQSKGKTDGGGAKNPDEIDTSDELKADNQVMRALEILIGHHLFSKS